MHQQQFRFRYLRIQWEYGGYHEMPQKACERGFFHVIAFSKFFEMPQNPIILFSVPFCFKIDHVLIFCNAPLFPFSESDRKNGAFQKILT